MTKIFKTIAVAVLVAFTFGCTPETKQEAQSSNLSTEVVVDAQANEISLSFNALTDWNATSSEAWLKLSSESGKAGDVTLTVSVEANETFENRSATVTITTTALTTEFKITQKMSTDFEIEMVYQISAEAQTIDFDLKSNVEYNFTISADAASWISDANTKAAPKADVKSFEIAANDGLTPRSGVIVVSTAQSVFGIVVEQDAQFENLKNLSAKFLGRSMRIYDSNSYSYWNFNEFALTLSDEESNTKVVLALNVADDADFTTIPEGEFDVDSKDDHSAETFSIRSLQYNEPIYTTMYLDGEEVLVEDGYINISKEGDTYTIVAVLLDSKDNMHNFSYIGSAPAVEDNSFGGYVLEWSYAAQYDTYFSTKANKWYVTLVASKESGAEVSNMNYISFAIYGKAGDSVDPSEFPTGEFTLVAEETVTGTRYANGIKKYETGNCASMTFYENDGDLYWTAGLGSKVTINKNEDGTFNFDFDVNMSYDEYDDNWNYVATHEGTFKTVFNNIRNTVEVNTTSYTHQMPDGDFTFSSALTTQFGALYIGNKDIFEGLTTPIEWNSTGSLVIVSLSNINSVYTIQLPVVSLGYVFEKNFRDHYCTNQITDGTYTFSTVPADNVILRINYGTNPTYCCVKNSWTGTEAPISGGSVEIKDGIITYNLQATDPVDGSEYTFTGSHGFSIQYAQDWSSRAKNFRLVVN